MRWEDLNEAEQMILLDQREMSATLDALSRVVEFILANGYGPTRKDRIAVDGERLAAVYLSANLERGSGPVDVEVLERHKKAGAEEIRKLFQRALDIVERPGRFPSKD